jgi:subtilase family serine protease
MKRLGILFFSIMISLLWTSHSFSQTALLSPDLTVSFKGPTSAAQGENISTKVKISVKNKGNAEARNFHVDVILRESPTVEHMCGRGFIARLRPNESISSPSAMALPISIPGDIRSGNYEICAIADSTGVVIESNEGNNKVCHRIAIMERILKIDLPPKIPKEPVK